MFKKCLVKVSLVVALSFIAIMPTSYAFARGSQSGNSHVREMVKYKNNKYYYNNGHFYRPGIFGFKFSISTPPLGVTVSSLPFGCGIRMVKNTEYYYYKGVYYKRSPLGYVVSDPGIITGNSLAGKESVVINVPDLRGGFVAIALNRFSNGFVGPQGEYYSMLPTSAQLRLRYLR